MTTITSTVDQLHVCPICKKEPEIKRRDGIWSINCSDYGCKYFDDAGSSGASIQEVATQWNNLARLYAANRDFPKTYPFVMMPCDYINRPFTNERWRMKNGMSARAMEFMFGVRASRWLTFVENVENGEKFVIERVPLNVDYLLHSDKDRSTSLFQLADILARGVEEDGKLHAAAAKQKSQLDELMAETMKSYEDGLRTLHKMAAAEKRKKMTPIEIVTRATNPLLIAVSIATMKLPKDGIDYSSDPNWKHIRRAIGMSETPTNGGIMEWVDAELKRRGWEYGWDGDWFHDDLDENGDPKL